MFLHIGADVSVPYDQLLMILNARDIRGNAQMYGEQAKRKHEYRDVGNGEPKSIILSMKKGKEMVYGTCVASTTLEKRWRYSAMPKRNGFLTVSPTPQTERNK